MSEPTRESAGPSRGSEPGGRGRATAPPFSAGRATAQVVAGYVQQVAWVAALGAGGAVIAQAAWPGAGGVGLGVGLVGAMLVLARLSVDKAQAVAGVAAQAARDPAAAEDTLAGQLDWRPVAGAVRLRVYELLAVIRHHQRRFDESAAVCAWLLGRLGPAARRDRPRILLMLLEADLERRDLAGAYLTLVALHRTRLTLIESLQRLALQTRYEVLAGYPGAAAADAVRKVELAELMPAPVCGAMHAVLAAAAAQSEQPKLAAWLWARAELLCTADQLDRLRRGDPAGSPGVVHTAPTPDSDEPV